MVTAVGGLDVQPCAGQPCGGFDFTPFLPWAQLTVKPWWRTFMQDRPIPTRVLMVDDEPDQRELVRQWLEGLPDDPAHSQPPCDDGWRVTLAASPAEACALLQPGTGGAGGNAAPFDCVLLDLGMPSHTPQQVFDMVAACAGAGACGDGVPILVFSNNASDELREYCLSHGATNFIPKMSVAAEGLSREICEAMRWQELQREAAGLVASADEYRETASHFRSGHQKAHRTAHHRADHEL